MTLGVMAGINSPLFWALLIGWILTVVIHEFAHGLIAHLGGDYTIKERGGLTLNPLQYIDPVMSIGLPLLFILMGGIPLPGGSTYIRTDLLRSKGWESAVSLAGPAANLLIFFILLLLLQPMLGIFNIHKPFEDWSNAQVFVAALAVSQVFAVVLNLIPCPPLDGFNALAPFMPEDLVNRFRMPPMNLICMVVLFFVIVRLPQVRAAIWTLLERSCYLLGLGDFAAYQLESAWRLALNGN